jgi:hypothetical protein
VSLAGTVQVAPAQLQFALLDSTARISLLVPQPALAKEATSVVQGK